MILFRAPRSIAVFLAGMFVLCPRPCQSGSKSVPPAAAKTAAATWKIPGRALDAEGKPVAGATVYLAREDDADGLVESIVIAQTQTQADGRFQLIPLDSEIKKEMADPPAVFDVWVHKPGLAIAETNIIGEPSRDAFVVWMHKESPVAVRLRNPDGSPCAGASVTPIYLLHRGDHWFTVPKLLQAAAQTTSAADGLVEVRGGHGKVVIVAIKTARFGIQMRVVQFVDGPPAMVTLRELGTLEGRLVLAKGEKVDLSKLTLTAAIDTRDEKPDEHARTRPREKVRSSWDWYDRFAVHPDRALRRLPEGETSGIIETDNSFRIVRVVSRTPAVTKPFDEVEEPIRQVLLAENKKRALVELYSRTTVESPYIDDLSVLLWPSPPCTSATTEPGTTMGTAGAKDAFAP